MQKEIERILKEFKVKKVPASAIEKALGFSNGLLGKAAKGTTELSKEKFERLVEYSISEKLNKISELPENKEAKKQALEDLLISNKAIIFTDKDGNSRTATQEELDEAGMAQNSFVEFQKNWFKIQSYCEQEGITPEQLPEFHQKYLEAEKWISKRAALDGVSLGDPDTFQVTEKIDGVTVVYNKKKSDVEIKDLSAEPPKSNYSINTFSKQALEIRRKKMGLKPE